MPKTPQSTNKDAEVCSSCGMSAEDWSEAYKLGSQTYCCQGCAEQTGCTCNVDKTAIA
jgi:hypothetical protein